MPSTAVALDTQFPIPLYTVHTHCICTLSLCCVLQTDTLRCSNCSQQTIAKRQQSIYCVIIKVPIYFTTKGAHTRTSLARESGWARVPMTETRRCVECHEPESTHACVVKYIRAWLPSQAPRGGLAIQTVTCMDRLLRVWTDSYVYGQHLNFIASKQPPGVCKLSNRMII